MADPVIRITVEDLATGEKETADVLPGDYMLVCTEPCHLHYTQVQSSGRTHQLTIKGRIPR